MGVITITDIDYGQIFGPFPSRLTSTDPAYVIGMLTNDKHPEGVVLRVDTNAHREGLRAVDWLPYVSPARDEEEQNMEAYLKEGGVYYRTLRIVKEGEELLVWYSKDFSRILAVPELQTNSKRDDEQFICSHCGEMFDFPFPLRAHLKFKCAFTTEDSGPIKPDPTLPLAMTGNMYRSEITANHTEHMRQKSQHMISYMINNNSVLPQSGKRLLEDKDSSDSFSKKQATESNIRPRKGPAISHSIEELSKSHVPKSRDTEVHENGVDTFSENVSAFRKVEKSHSPEQRLSPLSPNRRFSPLSRDPSPSIRPDDSPSASSTSVPHTLPIHKHSQAQSSSLHSPHHRSSPSSSSSPQDEPCSSSMLPPARPPMKSHASAVTASRNEPTVSGGAPIMGLYMPRLPMMPPSPHLGMPGGAMLPQGSSSRGLPVTHSAFPDQIPPGLLEMCRATIPSVGPLTESFAANIRNSGVHETLAKQALFADRHISSLAFLKSINPMVEKLLQSTNPTMLSTPINALNLSQNWCAKCNATFRMTSDLVYHMRSHHKREFDPMKRKREEKLKCNICNETFRERHHLTRHMSSHA